MNKDSEINDTNLGIIFQKHTKTIEKSMVIFIWCEERDLNPHRTIPTTPSK